MLDCTIKSFNTSSEILELKHKDIKPLRDVLIEYQNNICPICSNTIERPCLDHEHKKGLGGSGLIRGALCSNCNAYLGKVENNTKRYGISIKDLPKILTNISKYLLQPHLPYLHPSEVEKPKSLSKRFYAKVVRWAKQVGIKVPAYPKSGTLTKPIEKMYKKYYDEGSEYEEYTTYQELWYNNR